MKLVSYIKDGQEQLGFLWKDEVHTLHELDGEIPSTMTLFLENWDYFLGRAKAAEQKLILTGSSGASTQTSGTTQPSDTTSQASGTTTQTSDTSRRPSGTVGQTSGTGKQASGIAMSSVKFLAPVPQPPSLRDGYAFRQHVETARRNRKLPMTEAFDEFPVFYFGNHKTVMGSGVVECMPDHFQQLDYELEVGIVICRTGKNIKAADADSYIGGLMILNDLSARVLQMEEMQLSLGPAKGKDFATTTGPWLVTLDELEPYVCLPPHGHIGKSWNLPMRARINGQSLSAGKLSDMNWTFAELIERASYGVELNPGDIIGSGTVGTGCLLELNGTGKLKDPEYVVQWLKAEDVIELEVEGLGILRNQMKAADSIFSILALKK